MMLRVMFVKLALHCNGDLEDEVFLGVIVTTYQLYRYPFSLRTGFHTFYNRLFRQIIQRSVIFDVKCFVSRSPHLTVFLLNSTTAR